MHPPFLFLKKPLHYGVAPARRRAKALAKTASSVEKIAPLADEFSDNTVMGEIAFGVCPQGSTSEFACGEVALKERVGAAFKVFLAGAVETAKPLADEFPARLPAHINIVSPPRLSGVSDTSTRF